MKPRRRPQPLIALACLLACAVAAYAQQPQAATTPPNRYIRIPPDGDLHQILQEKLLDRGDGPGRFEKPGIFSDFAKLDPKYRKRLLEIAQKYQDGRPYDANRVEQLREELEREFKGLGLSVDLPPAPGVGGKEKAHPPGEQGRPVGGGTGDQNSKAGREKVGPPKLPKTGEQPGRENLPPSERPAPSLWERARSEWESALEGSEHRLIDAEADRLVLPENFPLPIPDISGIKMPDLSLPDLPHGGLKFNLPHVGNLGAQPPSFDHIDTGLTVGQRLLWAVLAVLAALLAGRVLRFLWTRRRAAPARESLSPWSLDPASVETPAQLIAAFERLALLRLGAAARSSHHRDIADGLAGDDRAERRRCADALAALYEQARYDPDGVTLRLSQMEAARRDLRTLARAGAA